MIQVTRLNGREFAVNAEMIRFVEATPDTVLTLVGDEKVLVREPVDEVMRRVVAYQRSTRFAVRLDQGSPS